jgi:hypothetical protein
MAQNLDLKYPKSSADKAHSTRVELSTLEGLLVYL